MELENSFLVLNNADIDDPKALSNKAKETNTKKAAAAAAKKEEAARKQAAPPAKQDEPTKKQAATTSYVAATATTVKEKVVSYRERKDNSPPKVGSVSWRSLGNRTLDDTSNRNKSMQRPRYGSYHQIDRDRENMIHEQVLKKFAKFLENQKSNDNNSGSQQKSSRGKRGRKDKNGGNNESAATTEDAPSVEVLPQEPLVDDVQAKPVENVIVEDNASSVATNEEAQKDEIIEHEVVNKKVQGSERSNYTAVRRPLRNRKVEREVMTLQEYQKVLEEKPKSLLTIKTTEERKVRVASEFDNMQQLSLKKESDEFFVKPGKEKKDSRKQKGKQVQKVVSEIERFVGARATGARAKDEAPHVAASTSTSASESQPSDGESFVNEENFPPLN